MKRILSFIALCVNFPSFIPYCFVRKELLEDIGAEIHLVPFKRPSFLSFNYMMIFCRPFRSVFLYRVRRKSFPLLFFYPFLFRPLKTIEIGGDIGPGLAVYHSYCVVAPFKAGKNLSVNQGVTIGISDRITNGFNAPLIGDNVRICSNSVVFGGITIGNNVIIGAGSVINKNIPDNCTVVGNPARIVKKNGIKCDILL